MNEGKAMNTVGKYNDNIVNLQGVCFDMPDGRILKNVYFQVYITFEKDIKMECLEKNQYHECFSFIFRYISYLSIVPMEI